MGINQQNARVLQHPGWVPNIGQEPMKESKTQVQEGNDNNLVEEIYQINKISVGEGAATCLVCGSFLREGEPVVACVYQPAGEIAFQIGYILCGNDRDEYPSEFTLGVRELLVAGRVGWCSNGATQSSWPVLLAPRVLGVSAAATKSLRKCVTGEDQVELNLSSAECEVGR